MTTKNPDTQTNRLSVLLLLAGVACFWLLGMAGRTGGVTPQGWGEHALALWQMVGGARPYGGNFVHTEGHLFLVTAAPFAKWVWGQGWGLWGLTLYSRLLLTLAALLMARSAREAGLRGLAPALVGLLVMFHPFVLDLAMGFEGMADVVFYLSLAALGLVRGNGWLVGSGVAMAAMCRGGALPHGLLISLAFLVIYPKGWWRWLLSVLLAVGLILGPVWVQHFQGWQLSVIRFHWVKVFVQQGLPLILLNLLLAGAVPLAALLGSWQGWFQQRTGAPAPMARRVGLMLAFGLGPVMGLVFFLKGHLVSETRFVPTLLLMAIGALVVFQQAGLSAAADTPAPAPEAEPPLAPAGPAPLRNTLVLALAALLFHLALSLRWQVDRWQRPVRLRPLLAALRHEGPRPTLYGEPDLVAQALFEKPGLQLWRGFNRFDVSLFASLIDREVFLKVLEKDPPDFLLIDRDSQTAMVRSQSVLTWMLQNYAPVATNRRQSLLLLKHKGRY